MYKCLGRKVNLQTTSSARQSISDNDFSLVLDCARLCSIVLKLLYVCTYVYNSSMLGLRLALQLSVLED